MLDKLFPLSEMDAMQSVESKTSETITFNDVDSITCPLGDCARIIRGIKSGDMTIHSDGRVTLLSHEKAQEEIAKYQEQLKERPDCSSQAYWKVGILAVAEDFGLTEKVIDATVGKMIKGLDCVHGKAGRVLGYLDSANVENKSKTSERTVEEKVVDRAPKEVLRLAKRKNLNVTAYIGHAAFKAKEAMEDHERRCTYFSAIEGRIAQTEKSATIPIAWVVLKSKQEKHPAERKKPKESKNERPPEKDVLPTTELVISSKELEAEAPHEKPPRSYSVLNLNTAKIQKSTATLNHSISDDMNGSLSLSPSDPKKSTLGLSYNDIGYSRSLDGRQSQVSLSGKIQGVDGSVGFDPKRPLKGNVHLGCGCDKGSFAADVNMRQPLKSKFHGEAALPVSGVPVKVGGSVQLNRLQNTQVRVSLPTDLLDPVLPKSLRLGDVQILSLNIKKITNGIKKLTGRKKKRKKLKRVTQQIEVIEKKLEQARQMRKQWFNDLANSMIQKVDEHYDPILAADMTKLNKAIDDFIDQMVPLSALEAPSLDRKELLIDHKAIEWDKAKWDEFFSTVSEALFCFHHNNGAMTRLIDQLETIAHEMSRCHDQMNHVLEHYQEANSTFDETKTLLRQLILLKEKRRPTV